MRTTGPEAGRKPPGGGTSLHFSPVACQGAVGSPRGADGTGARRALLQAFFFSVHTFSTIGYGHITPVSLSANLLMTGQAVVGMFSLALSTGLIFARFSRPVARILFSKNMVVGPYEDIQGLMFRIANRRKTQIIEMEAQVIFSSVVEEGGHRKRRFHELSLERRKVTFLPLSWTIVHPIDDSSPLKGLDRDDCRMGDAEFLVLLTGIDETFSQRVHARSSYKAEEMIWGAKFESLFHLPKDLEHGMLSIDVSRLSEVKRL